MRSAQDAIPGSVIPLWFKPIKEGTYEIVCAQLCGSGHSAMRGVLVVESQAKYDAWYKENYNLTHPKTKMAAAGTAGPAVAGN
jgi:cytochrome c oxidase subunit 2